MRSFTVPASACFTGAASGSSPDTARGATSAACALDPVAARPTQAQHRAAPATPWILDGDTTIKVLYGKRDGAVVSYNPHKPGRPSHAIHTCWIGNLRLVLDAQLEPGNRHSPVHARGGLLALLEGLPQDQRPSWFEATVPSAASAR